VRWLSTDSVAENRGEDDSEDNKKDREHLL
jgi:hypothetical protein